jgi:hypothetical protein
MAKMASDAAIVYVDGQNIPHKMFDAMFAYLTETFDNSTVKVYNDASKPSTVQLHWCNDNGADYVSVLCKSGKNSVDIRIAVDAVYDGCTATLDSFVLVTNDSDFSHVASKLIARGKQVTLLHTQPEPPRGYSPKVKTFQIAAKGAPAQRSAPIKPAPPAAPVSVAPVVASEKIVAMNPDTYRGNFEEVARRIVQASPFYVTSTYLYSVYLTVTGKSWKSGKNYTAQKWLSELFPKGEIVFVQQERMPPNSGFVCTARFAGDEYRELRDFSRERFQSALFVIGIKNEVLKQRLRTIFDRLRSGPASISQILSILKAEYKIEQLQTRAIIYALGYGEAIEAIDAGFWLEAVTKDETPLRLSEEMEFDAFIRRFRRGVLWELSVEPDRMLPSCVLANMGAIFDLKGDVLETICSNYVDWVKKL